MMHIDKKILFFLVVFIAICIINCLIHEKAGRRFKNLLQHTFTEFILILIISSGIFFLIPHFFFDDAGFILRYLDHFRDGYFFRFNIQDAPVYGISGFLHGLFTGTLCWLHITTPEQALWLSNFIGFMVSGYFLFLILKKWIQPYWLVFPLWLLVLGSSKMFMSVASCGLETPLHMAFILSTIYFLIAKKDQLFFLMSALSIVSKLDAVPVVGILYFFYLVLNFAEIKTSLKKVTFRWSLFFLLPLGISMFSIYLIFGSILPQSAYSKLYHHSHPSDHWFPFLQYFTDTVLQRIMLISFLIVMTFHFAEWVMLRTRESFARMLSGTLFISCMILYYFYNPIERMAWYYAMPEMFMVLQIIYSFYYFISTYIKSKMKWISVIAIMSIIACHTFADLYYGLNWTSKTVRVTENERRKIGEMLGYMSASDETLLSGHGLISRHFKGYVLDASGLNSKVVTDYKRDTKLLIEKYQPDWIINHAFPEVIEVYNQYNYGLWEIFRDITLGGYPSWILLRKMEKVPINIKLELKLIERGYTPNIILQRQNVPLLMPKNGSITIYCPINSAYQTLNIGLERKNRDYTVTCHYYKEGLKSNAEMLAVSKIDNDHLNPAMYIGDFRINISEVDSVVFKSDEEDFKIIEPIFELHKKRE